MIVHRDLKPDNILIGKGSIAKIGDFGCSIQLGSQEDVLQSRVGSPAYMDKRMTKGDNYSLSVDIYAMGIIFYFMWKKEGIFDRCQTEAQLDKMRSGIYANHD